MSRRSLVDFRAVKAAVSIVQILEHYDLMSQLKANAKGDSLSGSCPLHKGTNPTQFRVSVPKNCWHCFSECQHGGNIIDFVALKEDCTIREAALRIAEWFDLPQDQEPDSRSSGGATASSALVTAPGAYSSHGEKKEPVPMLRPQGVVEAASPDDTIPNKPLSFTLRSLDQTHPYLMERGLSKETVAEFGLGLCTKGTLNGWIVIPIHNGEGQLVAYAGRWPGEPPNGRPKYQLPKGFRKSLEVFNLHRVKQSDAGTPLILVEGFFDCIKVWQAGMPRVVALMGSALSPTQEELIMQCVGPKGQIALMFDEDNAGHAARADALRRFASRAYVRVIELQRFGRQPDELSTEALHALLLREETPDYHTEPGKFPLGRLVATPNALHTLSELDIRSALARHRRGDWGELDPHDREENELGLEKGFRLFSVYKAADGTSFWIITEADRSVSTVLLPEDY